MNDTGNKNRAIESECGPFHLSQLRGAQSIVFTKAPYLLSAASVAGSKEAQGPLGKCFDLTNEDDLFGAETWRKPKAICRRKPAYWHWESRMWIRSLCVISLEEIFSDKGSQLLWALKICRFPSSVCMAHVPHQEKHWH